MPFIFRVATLIEDIRVDVAGWGLRRVGGSGRLLHSVLFELRHSCYTPFPLLLYVNAFFQSHLLGLGWDASGVVFCWLYVWRIGVVLALPAGAVSSMSSLYKFPIAVTVSCLTPSFCSFSCQGLSFGPVSSSLRAVISASISPVVEGQLPLHRRLGGYPLSGAAAFVILSEWGRFILHW